MNPPRPHGRHGTCGLVGWALCSALFLWIANGVAVRDWDRNNAWHHYQYLVDGFLEGHTHLSIAPAKELLALPDPRDPAQNLSFRLWDASLYEGKYYLYYGPAPALLLMLPWKLLTAADLPQRLATGIFACVGFAALTLLLADIRRQCFPSVTPVRLLLVILLVGQVSWLPVILRRPAFWELPIVTAGAMLFCALYFLWRYHSGGERKRWAFAAGCALACAIGSRPTYLFTAAFIGLLFALPLKKNGSLLSLLRRLLPVAIPLAVGGLGLLAYNFARFGHPLEFGQRFSLWGIDEREVHHFSLSYFPFNTWIYLFSLPEVSPYFPFFRSVWPTDLPPGYIATEEMPGLLFALPIHLLGVAALHHAWRRRDRDAAPLRLTLVGAAGASLLAAGLLFCFAGACSRYIAELVAGWSVVTGVGCLALSAGDLSGRWWNRAGLLVGVAAGWSVLCTWLASLEFRNFARATQPAFYHAVAETLNYPSYWAARNSGQVYGPVALDIRVPEGAATGSTMLIGSGREGMVNNLLIERPAPGRIQLKLVENDLSMVETPVLAIDGPVLHIVCHAPWLYPPVDHPYWRTYSDPGERGERQTMFAIEINGVRYARFSEWFFDSTAFDPFVHRASVGPAIAWVEKILRVPAAPLPVLPPRP
ncbi:MAG TPA: hypothetical protein VG838_10360 [Opitutaceae bacterium]|nr:hypothetical protein [Opitutaceae bacterium]